MSDAQGGPSPRVLLLEPDPALRRLASFTLGDSGLGVTAPEEIEDVMALITKHQPDALVLDLGREADLSALAEIKDRFGLPVLVITGQGDHEFRTRAFELGADDLLLKPMDIGELASRVRFVLGTPAERAGSITRLAFGTHRIEIDKRSRRVKRNDDEVVLSSSEWALLAGLAERPGEPRFDGELLVKAFGQAYRLDSAYLALWIGRLRQKLGDDLKEPHLIRRYHGAAYILDAYEAAEGTAAS